MKASLEIFPEEVLKQSLYKIGLRCSEEKSGGIIRHISEEVSVQKDKPLFLFLNFFF